MTGKTLGISNTHTAVSARVEANTSLTKGEMDPLVKRAQAFLPHDQLYGMMSIEETRSRILEIAKICTNQECE